MENNITKFVDRVLAYNRDKEELERRRNEILNRAAEDLQPLIGKTVEIKTKYKTYTGTAEEFSGWPGRNEYIRLNPCTTGVISIHFLSICDIKVI